MVIAAIAVAQMKTARARCLFECMCFFGCVVIVGVDPLKMLTGFCDRVVFVAHEE
jgi:hypothetical protein